MEVGIEDVPPAAAVASHLPPEGIAGRPASHPSDRRPAGRPSALDPGGFTGRHDNDPGRLGSRLLQALVATGRFPEQAVLRSAIMRSP